MYVSVCVCLNLATSIVYILVYICMIMMQEHTIEQRKASRCRRVRRRRNYGVAGQVATLNWVLSDRSIGRRQDPTTSLAETMHL